ncbi:putative complex1_LYR-like [Lyophyllum shimeji]|uniref:LYR motif-containing protein 2 n=1 Tax=Lyophyllum shimeji TaxID=47721 RepID=A0A9P3PI12_LYOSH|nr:putative complex1_LYR-like [Lyophyllum shimeji]
MLAPDLTLKHFILKQRVLNLYRYVLRASRAIPDPVTRRETVAWIRGEFERDRHLSDVALIEEKIKMTRREVKQILPTL